MALITQRAGVMLFYDKNYRKETFVSELYDL